MTFRRAGRSSHSPRRHPAVAVFAALSLFAAAFGFWALQVGTQAGSSQHGAVPAAATAPAPSGVSSAPRPHPDFGSTLDDDKAFKSAGLKRDRPTTFSLSVPRWAWTLSFASATGAQRPIEACSPRAPSTVLAAQDILTIFCVSRR
ncbi:hypothetical protein A5679_19855 [Mycobacterium scrofulaceum]|uniref:Uncharacterized protein n=1 Tax=Mycobacterium scrofulaceum TaxID=1783 RepID=A0A1A2VFB5_MYCSC|nr:hypothetical protein A5679_19855 [Mycobacterium scrofulaceum]